MVKLRSGRAGAYCRSSRAHRAVERADPDVGCPAPTSDSTRARISPAALFVNVIARISNGRAWPPAETGGRRGW